ncbi:PREDICTED: uncharacterized protein LOC107068181 [Polistes dominula]|uniref:Uncharacterized protein LOC107068181 n=1 Tax=Polistes dominula TaxID=743375 RepID=A0ABM1IHX5_POLDO|nr:PREDICTED: uncharacterized protein LOC107068181 [Polistes dominula]
MAKSCDSIVLCKEVPEQTVEERNYLTYLKTAGYKCKYLYTSQFEFVNSSDLKSWLINPEFFDGNIFNINNDMYVNVGLLLTSEHAVEAICNILREDEISLSRWQKLPAYCLGHAISSLAKNNLGLEFCLGSETDDTKDLVEIMISRKALIIKPLLYPCTEIAQGPFEVVLSKNTIYLYKIVAYWNAIRQSFKADVLNNVSTKPKIFVFFSPLCVDYFVSILRDYPACIKNVKAVAIDPETEENLIEAKFEVYATAANPNPTSLLEAIINAGVNSRLDITI